MRKIAAGKLSLNRETLRALSSANLADIHGGGCRCTKEISGCGKTIVPTIVECDPTLVDCDGGGGKNK
jgi:hypothetical protein